MGNVFARVAKWSAAFPNARLAVFGLFLIFLAGSVLQLVEASARPVFHYLREHVGEPNWEYYWNAYVTGFWCLGILMVVPMLAGMTMIPFAGYRALRDFLARCRNRRTQS